MTNPEDIPNGPEDPGNPEDKLPAIRAVIDQLITFAPEQARAMFELKGAYTGAGFSDEEAMQVVMEHIRIMMT